MLVTRYLFRNLLIATLFVAVTLTAVIWLTQSLKLLELVASSDAPASLFLKLVLLSLPRFLEIILPLSLVVSILFTYNKLIMDNELIVMRACGLDQLGLAKPALILAGAVTAVLLSLTVYVSPRTNAEMEVLRQAVKAQYSAFLLREGVFNTFGDDLTVYLRKRDDSGGLYGLMIHDTREKDKPPVTITAKKGRIVMDGDVPTIVVSDGMRQQMSDKNDSLSRLYFSRYTIEIKNFAAGSAVRWHEANERTMKELLNPDMSNPRDRTQKEAFLAEFNHRIVTPFNAVTFTLLALGFILTGSFNRRGQNKKILSAAGAVAAAQVVNLAVVSIMKKKFVFTGLLYAATFLPALAGLWILHETGEQALKKALRAWRQRAERRATA